MTYRSISSVRDFFTKKLVRPWVRFVLINSQRKDLKGFQQVV